MRARPTEQRPRAVSAEPPLERLLRLLTDAERSTGISKAKICRQEIVDEYLLVVVELDGPDCFVQNFVQTAPNCAQFCAYQHPRPIAID